MDFLNLVANESINKEINDTVLELSEMSIKVSFMIEFFIRHENKILLNFLNQCEKEPNFMLFFNVLKKSYIPKSKKNDYYDLKKK